jgi:adenosylcobinamide kinase / adenosylcobinamide-phosphate guanylyltransferase
MAPVPSSARSVLILGGARSGKSAFALALAEAASPRRLYLATGSAGDEEMAARIARHQAERGAGWSTREAPLELAAALEAEAREHQVIVVDCLTLWLGNWIFAGRNPGDASGPLCAAIASLRGPALFVSNEVGFGIVPQTKLGRDFRDWQGRLNQDVARVCDAVVLVSAGLPSLLKPAPALQIDVR